MKPETAREIAKRVHNGQWYGRIAYFLHVKDVAERVGLDLRTSPDAVTVAWLHDVLEDTPVQISHLRAQGLTAAQEAALVAITRMPGESYYAYVARVSEDRLAVLVKYHDLRSNLDHDAPDRLAARYDRALRELTPFLEAHYARTLPWASTTPAPTTSQTPSATIS
jgi:hypothetical protein